MARLSAVIATAAQTSLAGRHLCGSNRITQRVSARNSSGLTVRRRRVQSCAAASSTPFPSSSHGPRGDVAAKATAQAISGSEETQPIGNRHTIWFSDVEAQKQKATWNRRWDPKDKKYLAFMAVMHGLCLFAPATFSWSAFAAFAVLYFITGCLGITLTYHRLLSHKAFEVPKWLEYTLAYCGVQALQGDPIDWVSSHRHHHAYCDTDNDPHTPKHGFWHSHIWWMMDVEETDRKKRNRNNAKDLEKQPFYKWIEKTYFWHPVAMCALLFALGGFPFVVWGMALRCVWVYHVTWAVNSVSHVWGYQRYNTGDLSKNNYLIGILAWGEGFHNAHHAFESSARHGLKWWEIDVTWYIISALKSIGLVRKVQLPSEKQIAKLSLATN